MTVPSVPHSSGRWPTPLRGAPLGPTRRRRSAGGCSRRWRTSRSGAAWRSPPPPTRTPWATRRRRSGRWPGGRCAGWKRTTATGDGRAPPPASQVAQPPDRPGYRVGPTPRMVPRGHPGTQRGGDARGPQPRPAPHDHPPAPTPDRSDYHSPGLHPHHAPWGKKYSSSHRAILMMVSALFGNLIGNW